MADKTKFWIVFLKINISLSKRILDLFISKSFIPPSYKFWVSVSLYWSVNDSGDVEAEVVCLSALEYVPEIVLVIEGNFWPYAFSINSLDSFSF